MNIYGIKSNISHVNLASGYVETNKRKSETVTCIRKHMLQVKLLKSGSGRNFRPDYLKKSGQIRFRPDLKIQIRYILKGLWTPSKCYMSRLVFKF